MYSLPPEQIMSGSSDCARVILHNVDHGQLLICEQLGHQPNDVGIVIGSQHWRICRHCHARYADEVETVAIERNDPFHRIDADQALICAQRGHVLLPFTEQSWLTALCFPRWCQCRHCHMLFKEVMTTRRIYSNLHGVEIERIRHDPV